jgi:tripartite-type tricarboxylate transporter receptor subunit TctC
MQAAALSSLGLAGTARAAAYPSKPITLIVPFPTGASFDGVMRPLADAAAQDLGQPVLLINKPGAGGVTGTASLATMQADGYTLAVMHNTMLRQPYMTEVSWDPLRDFTYIAGLAGLVVGIVVAPDAPWQTLDELLADARKRPGEITWGNAGATSVMRIYAERLARAAGVKFNYVPFKGGAESFNALIGRHLDVYGDPGFGAMAKAGKVRLLATFTEQRAPRWPQVPTVKELGHDLVIKTNIGIVAPKGLDPAIASRLEAALLKATKNADYQRMMDEFDFVPWEVSGATYRSYAEAQFPREKQMLDEIGFKPE